MERRSDHHGPRLDDALADDVEPMTRGYPPEPRADEAREQEGPAEGEPTPDSRIRGDRDLAAAADELTDEEVARRSDLARHLRPAVFPATADELAAVAEQEGADAALLAQLRSLSVGTRFENVQAVWKALGGRAERRD